ncbi:MAG: bifunctional UDP-N-acetylmuramoyl-tripeptide:D-alanyl-D-alanine ligase/alanine racemase, partial [Bacteroidota bacterium]
LNMTQNHEIGIFEAGISQKNEMSALAAIIQPDLGIFTMLGEAHDDGFPSKEEKLREKLQLFQDCKKVVCQSDQPWYGQIQATLGDDKLITWSLQDTADYHVFWGQGSIKINDTTFQVHLSDRALLQNITHCIVTSIHLGVPTQKIQSGLDVVTGLPMRLELKRGVNGCYILDDTYNNDLEGLKVAMDYMEGQKQNQSKTLILSDIVHSRKSHETLYKEIAKLIEHKKFERFIGIGPKMIAHKHLFPSNAIFFESVKEIMAMTPSFNQEMILIKGARNFQLEKLVKKLEERTHGTVLEVNFEALQYNLNTYRRLLRSSTKMMVMVKANAYGSGLLEVGNFLQHQHVDYLGVAYVDEAIQLRKNGVKIPIMIMNPYIESFSRFPQFNLEPEIFSIPHLEKFLNEVSKTTPVHIKIDTGMHRLGFREGDIPQLIQLLKTNTHIKVASIFTHFSSAETEAHDQFTVGQAELFDNIYQQIEAALGYAPLKHAANSAAIARWPQYQYDMVRLGIGLHGYDPVGKLTLSPASKLKSVVSQIQSLTKGETIGYTRKGVATRDSQIAIIPIGYEDGFSRSLGNGNFYVEINNTLFPTIGNVCMDMCMIDVTDGDVSEGDPVVIFKDYPSMKELAKAAHTIPHEILTNISGRVKRIFISE